MASSMREVGKKKIKGKRNGRKGKKKNKRKKKKFKIIKVALSKHVIQGSKMPLIIVEGVNCN